MLLFRRKVKLVPAPEDDDASIGNVLVRTMTMTQGEVHEALSLARRRGGRLGDAALALGYCTPEELNKALGIQEKLRSGRDGSAALDEMEARLDRVSAGEDRLRAQIECSREAVSKRGEPSGSFVLPIGMRKARA